MHTRRREGGGEVRQAALGGDPGGLFALVDGTVEFTTKGPNKRRTVNIVAAAQ